MYLGSYMYCATFSPPASLQSAPATRPLKSKNRRPASRSVQNALPRPRARARIGSRPAHPISLASRWREERAARSRQQPGPRLAVVRTTGVISVTPMAWAPEQRIVEHFGRFLCFDEDSESEDISLDELEEELEEHKDYDVLITILRNGEKQRGLATLVEGNLGHIEESLIEDYIEDNDNLALLHDQIHECDIILSQIGSLLSGFQAHIGSISSEIRSLQVKSLDISVQLKNRKLVETKLAGFVEEIIAPPGLVDILVSGEVNDGYARSLEILSKKLKFVQVNPLINASKALNDITQELERLRQKALSKVSSHIIEIFFAMRKPGTNIQILQQNLLQKHRYLVVFLKEHGSETYGDLCASYVNTMNKVLSTYFRVYVEALERLKLDIGASSDLSGHYTSITDIITRGREHLRDHRFMFSLGERANILKEIDQPGLVPQVNSHKYPYEVIFRSIEKLLMDTASSEYLFIEAFFGEESLFYQVFEGPFAVIDHHLDLTLPKCHDAVCLMLMICITRKHQLVMSNRQLPCLENYFDKAVMYLWPRFKLVFDMYLRSSYQCDAKTLWIDGTHPHHIVRCYVEFTASLVQLNAECGDGQLDMNLERLRSAIDGLLVRLAQNFTTPKLQHLFVLNNYDMAISVMKEAGDEAKNLQRYFEDKLESNMMAFVDDLLMEHFSDLLRFVRSRVSEDLLFYTEHANIDELEPVVKNFAMKWRSALEIMHNEVVTSCSNLLSGMAILKAAMAQLLNDYNRLSECVKKIPAGSALNRHLVSITSISYEIRKYSRAL
ncbi:vacuolar protein sorting-associated protein 52 A-like isoform X2 [Panicum hallii]|uniref:vacuolar protein sorting-associated protein 52 A-like isoform X2 n=1 Tax=Panicum hallii TaxID=206008 RepID=UPI000DF4E815|nr:vacuolar protein sorting-associated protein 52 A-like isoform X2 [Panicum hallii]